MSVFTSEMGDHNFTAGSMPLEAIKQALGCGWTQFTIETSPQRA